MRELNRQNRRLAKEISNNRVELKEDSYQVHVNEYTPNNLIRSYSQTPLGMSHLSKKTQLGNLTPRDINKTIRKLSPINSFELLKTNPKRHDTSMSSISSGVTKQRNMSQSCIFDKKSFTCSPSKHQKEQYEKRKKAEAQVYRLKGTMTKNLSSSIEAKMNAAEDKRMKLHVSWKNNYYQKVARASPLFIIS